MVTVDEIVAAAEQLKPDQFLRLRYRLDQIKERVWEAESAQARRDLETAGVTDEGVDQIVMRRRREGRR